MRSYTILQTENQELKKKIRILEDKLDYVKQSVTILNDDNKRLKENLDSFKIPQLSSHPFRWKWD